MPTLHEFLDARQGENDDWSFHVPRSLHGAFGGAFGGVVAACTLVAARSVAPGRVPNAIDCRFVRGLGAGGAVARPQVIASGRTLSNVSVDLLDEQDRLCCRATISLVDPEMLHSFDSDPVRPGDWKDHADAAPWPALAPIVEVIDSRIVGQDERGIATAVVVPWEVSPDDSAEAACMAADMSVGPPVGGVLPRGVGAPNPDISLRFCGEVATDVLVGACRLDRAHGGVAATRIEVWSGRALVANGVSTTLLLPPP